MAMRVEDRIHPRKPGAQGLLAKIRPGVDHHHALAPRSCQRRSTDGLSRRSCGSGDVHTAHVHPKVGTPMEVPVPRNVSSPSIEASALLGGRGRRRRHTLHRDHVRQFEKCHPDIEQHRLQRALLDIGQIALGLLREHAQ